MNEIINNWETFPVLARPFSLPPSTAATVTKLFETKFLCTEQGIYELYNTVSEKISHLDPISAGFQFLVTFSDRTHFEHQEITKVKEAITNNSKTTERLTLKWVVHYKLREIENELTVVLRIANPINPLLFLQAALSKAPNDFDNLEFERCPVSVSVSGASQILAEEVFAVVGKWIDSRPQPQYITNAHNKIADNQNLDFGHFSRSLRADLASGRGARVKLGPDPARALS